MSPQKNKVIIIGCGIAGPVIALLLKQKGYEPTVIEKVKQLGDVGGSLMMMPNGYEVLQSTICNS
jgi:salicylate hydroxylase